MLNISIPRLFFFFFGIGDDRDDDFLLYINVYTTFGRDVSGIRRANRVAARLWSGREALKGLRVELSEFCRSTRWVELRSKIQSSKVEE